MTHEEKINYMRIAAGIAQLGFDNHHLDKLVSLYEYVIEKEGDGNLRDIARIEVEVEKRQVERKAKKKKPKIVKEIVSE